MKVLIVEDENIAAEKLSDMLLAINKQIDILAITSSVKETERWLAQNEAELIFLDIQLSDGLSFSIFENNAVETPVIFTTAYDQYAIKAFELYSIDYLLKPISKTKLEQSIEKFNRIKSTHLLDFKHLNELIQSAKPTYKKRFIVQIGDHIKKIDTTDIAYFYSWEKSTYLTTNNGHTYPLDLSLDSIMNMLDPECFFRINRKYIVQMGAIKKMTAFSRSRIKLTLTPPTDNPDAPLVSVERAARFKQWIDK